ncbi:MAG: hypothetical protein KME64_41135 [Scytonematopsis contorta HA4267-MV1]|jgi:hypothetical protein|nr:hypothetical protein [Scytonematopsis contorta HA4267-MV1]
MVTLKSNLNLLDIEVLKKQLFDLVKGKDKDKLSNKVNYFNEVLSTYFDEFSKRNSYPAPESQVELVMGIWQPIWSTIPFHDNLPGRIPEQSYQIFHESGFYANIARYAPGGELLSNLLPAYDFLVMQSYAVTDSKWDIQNVGIFQSLKSRNCPLCPDLARKWFDGIRDTKYSAGKNNFELEGLDKSVQKKFETTYLAKPLFEHTYIDNDLRLVKTQRSANQRPSYTIAVRV